MFPTAPTHAHTQAARAREAALEATEGVHYTATLTAVPLSLSEAAGRGIRRAVDKARLPPAAGAALLAGNARRHGAPVFRVEAAAEDGAPTHTHVGVLDYGAESGTIALPPHAAAQLWPSSRGGVPPGARLAVAYARLPKGTSVALRPTAAGFHEAAGEGVKEILEGVLSGHCALTLGDTLSLPLLDATDADATDPTLHTLTVTALEPGAAVSVIETDLECVLEPSAETEARLAAESRARAAAAEATAAAAARVRAMRVQASGQAASVAAVADAPPPTHLPPEPPAGTPAATLRVRTPDGRSASRRFPLDAPTAVVYDWVAGLPGGGAGVAAFDVAAGVPPRALPRGEATTLAAALQLGEEGGGSAVLVRPQRE